MKLPRFRIAWVMVFVALVAINLWAIRALSNLQFRAYFVGPLLRSQVIGILILGGLPMANVLAVGLLSVGGVAAARSSWDSRRSVRRR